MLLSVLLHRIADRVAPGRLCPVHFRRHGRVHDSRRVEFVERLVDLADERAARHRHDDVLREPPAEILGDLIAHRFGSLGIEGPQIDVHEAPAVLHGDLRTEAIDFVVGTHAADDFRAVYGGAEDFRALEVGGNEDERIEARTRRLGRHAVRKVARTRTANGRHAELAGLAERHGDNAIFERKRREIDRIVLEPEFANTECIGEAVGPNQRRATDVTSNGRFARQWEKLAVAPHVRGAALEQLSADFRLDLCVIVRDFERPEIIDAEVDCRFGVQFAADAALHTHYEFR